MATMSRDEIIEFLWQIIDDIDTVSDMVKGNDEAYRMHVHRLQAKRWQTGIETDGYSLFYPWDDTTKLKIKRTSLVDFGESDV